MSAFPAEEHLSAAPIVPADTCSRCFCYLLGETCVFFNDRLRMKAPVNTVYRPKYPGIHTHAALGVSSPLASSDRYPFLNRNDNIGASGAVYTCPKDYGRCHGEERVVDHHRHRADHHCRQRSVKSHSDGSAEADQQRSCFQSVSPSRRCSGVG